MKKHSFWQSLKKFCRWGSEPARIFENLSVLHCWKIILNCYVAMTLQMKDSWPTNSTFGARTINKIEQNYLM